MKPLIVRDFSRAREPGLIWRGFQSSLRGAVLAGCYWFCRRAT
jgi:hypothetical protein